MDIAESAAEALRQLRADGNNDTACQDAAEGMKTTVTHAVNGLQEALNALDNGSSCADEGAAAVDALQGQHEEAADALEAAKDGKEKAKDQMVTWEYYVTEVAPPIEAAAVANLFRSDTDYLAALAALTASETELTASQATESAAAAALATAQAAQSSVKDCRCQVLEKHQQQFAIANESQADFGDDWARAVHILCALEGKAAGSCDVPPVPTVERPQLPSDVQNVAC